VGAPPRGSSTEIKAQVQEIEDFLLQRVQGKDPESESGNVKEKIIRVLSKKS
jgi:hypothetical protein